MRVHAGSLFWYGLGAVLCLLSVDFLRPGFGGIGLPLAALLLIAQGAVALVWGGLNRTQDAQVDEMRPPFFLLIPILAFWVWHMLSALRAEEFEAAMAEHIRLTVGMVLFLILLQLRGASHRSQEQLWRTHFVFFTLLLLLLLFRYGVVFRVPFLGTSWDAPTRFGKNQLGWFLAVTLPYLFAFFVIARRGPRVILPVLVATVAWLYLASRGSWLCGGIGIGLCMFSTRTQVGRAMMVRRLGGLFSVIVMIAAVGLMALPPAYSNLDFDLLSRLSMGTAGGTNSVSDQVRVDMLERNLTLFERFPVIGYGLTNSSVGQTSLSHSDFLLLLADTGAIGIVLFGAVLVALLMAVWMVPASSWYAVGARGSIVASLLYFGLINVYTSPMFWIMAGLALLPGGTDRRPACLTE